MNIAIVGFSVEGRATYDYFARQGGHRLTICDQDTSLQLPEAVQGILGDAYLDNLGQFDLVVRSAGIHPRQILDKNPDLAGKITSQINIFLEACPTKNIIGVTGTKGKGTTSTLITKMLEANGQRVFLGGNIGVAPLSFIDQIGADDWVVLELSSFQLIDTQRSPHIGVCLMVVPEHLNWHADMEEYLVAKEQLFAHQTADDIAIYNAENDNSYRIASAGLGQTVPFMTAPGAAVQNGFIAVEDQQIISVDDIRLLGKHNWQNVCAAVTTLWLAGFTDPEPLRKVLGEFSGLEHRLEFVREYNGIKLFNDSFSSGLLATEAAIDAVPGQKVMIVGGFDRMLPLEHFVNFVSGREDIRTLMIVGQSGPRLIEALQAAEVSDYTEATDVKTMPEVVQRALSLAQNGDSIVLSPGFASFDMFKNFEDRGQQFKATVSAL
ncbi:UDP-N-acetylmuramoyl-L-alanine--D-glutamate ligase [Candidatus Saccharibacteria bacterium]|nr:UDP-N-acetylmuramoyl-L-alanine--D-glutamate ligase [Candidatus Saccharibacteria bacterium]